MNPRTTHPGARPERGAFTLLELLVAMTAASVLMAALGSVFVLASRALPQGQGELTSAPLAARALERLGADVACAVALPSGTATGLTVSVPDRTGDGSAETVVYAWDGTPGHALTRTVNGGASETLVSNVRSFGLGYEYSTLTSGSAGGGTGAEQTLMSISSGGTSYAQVTSLSSIGQSFQATLPAECTSWSVTRVALRLRSNGSTDGQVALQVRPVDSSGKPTSTVLGQTLVNEAAVSNTLTTYALSAPGLTPGQQYCVLVVYRSGTFVAAEPAVRGATPPMGSAYIESGALGIGWNTSTSKGLECTVYGQATSPTTAVSVSTSLERVVASLRAENDGSPMVTTAARALNRPAVMP